MIKKLIRICCILLMIGCVFTESRNPSIHTSQGTIIGLYYKGIERFSGIPYALPPIGSKRFARAKLYDEQYEIPLDATKLGAPCIQNPLGDPRPPSIRETIPPPSEDCLHLNIFKPSNISEPIPIMVYVFGGGLCAGSSNNHYFDGTSLVKEHNVIVVVVSYRLG